MENVDGSVNAIKYNKQTILIMQNYLFTRREKLMMGETCWGFPSNGGKFVFLFKGN